MGWSSGTELFDALIEAVSSTTLDKEERRAVYRRMLKAFTDADWDSPEECLGDDPAYDAAYKELYGGDEEEPPDECEEE